MADMPPKPKITFPAQTQPQERLVDAWEGNDSGSFYKTTFPVSAVERVRANSNHYSHIIFRSGMEIGVSMPREELVRQLYMPEHSGEMARLNLSVFTGKQPAQWPSLYRAGTKMADGSFYLCHQEDKDWYVAAENLQDHGKLAFDFRNAAIHAKASTVHGYNDWQVPDVSTLDLMFKHRHHSSFAAAFRKQKYRSSTQTGPNVAYYIDFDTGGRSPCPPIEKLPVRLVRSVARKVSKP